MENLQVKFGHPNTLECLCFTHAVQRAIKGEKISAMTTDRPVCCSDCFMESLRHTQKIKDSFEKDKL